MTENMVRFIMVQIFDIVQKLAKNHVAHRDIKDENIMINLSTYQGILLTNWTIAKSVISMVWKFSRNRHFRRKVFFEGSYFSVIFLSKYDWLKILKSNWLILDVQLSFVTMICLQVSLEHPNFIPTNGSIPVIIVRLVALFGPLGASCLLYLLVRYRHIKISFLDVCIPGFLTWQYF